MHIGIWIRHWFAAFMFCVGGMAHAAAERAALVIGNSQYAYVSDLANPVNDAADIADALERIGFDVMRGNDLGYREMRLALRDFAELAAEAEVALIYYAGHGIEIDSTNYLIPVNAELQSDRDIDFEALPLDTLLNAIEGSKGLKLVMLDACRNNPFLAEMQRTSATRSIGRGLAGIDPGGTLVGYAARGGTLALDGDGRNSPYAQAILSHIEEPGLELGQMFRRIRDTVISLTNGYQEPFTYGSLPGGSIYLVPAAAPAPAPEANPPAADDLQSLLAAFERADTLNTIINWESFLQEFGKSHPDNRLIAVARSRRAALTSQASVNTRSADWLDVSYDASGVAVLDRDKIAKVQRSLSYSGFDPGPADGQMGPRTLRAVSLARAREGLSAEPRIDAMLLRTLVEPDPVDALRSDGTRKYMMRDAALNLEPRLKRVIELFQGYEYRFDYFEGRLYVALLNNRSGNNLTWQLAGQLAQAAGGHLAVISDRDENAFVRDLFAREPRFLSRQDGRVFGPGFGLFRLEGSAGGRDGWTWVTGEDAGYSNWAPGEPNNETGRERFAKFEASGGGSTAPLTWGASVAGHRRDGEHMSGFILEFE